MPERNRLTAVIVDVTDHGCSTGTMSELTEPWPGG
jgi:hypothetical protein